MTSQATEASAKPIVDAIYHAGIVAIVRVDDLSNALPLTNALIDGGVHVIEFTLTNPEAVETIRRVRDAIDVFPNGKAIIGAGSVITVRQTEAAIEAGAQFVVAPNTNPDVVRFCVDRQVPVVPGAYTPTEIQNAWEMGANAVKVFPARSLGSAYIKDVRAPLPHLQLVPTGGVDLNNLAEFFKVGVYAVGVGSSLVKPRMIKDGDWEGLRQLAQQYADIASQFRE